MKRLSDVANIRTGKLDANAAEENGAYPFFTCDEKPLRIGTYDYDLDAILLAGNNAQGNFHIQRFKGKFNAYQRTYIITAKEGYDIDYLKYSIEVALQHLKKVAQGSQTKFLTMEILNSFNVKDVDYSEQKNLVASLKAIDSLIANNNLINDNLERMASDTYMRLFFKRSTNGKLSEIIGENDKSTVQVGVAKEQGGKYPFFTSGDAILTWKNKMVEDRNCYLNTGGNAGVKFYVGQAAYSTDTWCITGKNDLADYLYLLLKSILPELNKKFFQGTGLKHLQKPLLKDRFIYIPSETEAKDFNSRVQPMFDMISANIRENQELIHLRDWLLPMLMNGQATVSD